MAKNKAIDDAMQRLLRGTVRERQEETLAFVQRTGAESDRGAVLIVAAHADNLLESLLRAASVSHPVVERLIGSEGDSPLGSFSSRIMATFALGLIPERLFLNLEQLRKARNYCAHHVMGVDFSDQKLVAHIRNIRMPGNHPMLEDVDFSRDSPRLRIMGLAGELQGWVRNAVPIAEANAMRRELTALHDSAMDGTRSRDGLCEPEK